MKLLSSLLMMFLATGAFAGSPATPDALLGKLAQTKAMAPGVKEFGAMMVKDHSAANEKVKALAASRNVTLPRAPSAEQRETLKGLQMQNGAQFDRAYIEAQVKAHEKTVAMLQAEIATGRDADTKALAQEPQPQ